MYFLQNIIWGVGVLKTQGGCCVYGVYRVYPNKSIGGGGYFSNTCIVCVEHRVMGNVGLLVLILGCGLSCINLTMLDFKFDF